MAQREIDCVNSLLVSYEDTFQGKISDVQKVNILADSVRDIIDHHGLSNMVGENVQIFLAEGRAEDIRPFNDILVPLGVVSDPSRN